MSDVPLATGAALVENTLVRAPLDNDEAQPEVPAPDVRQVREHEVESKENLE